MSSYAVQALIDIDGWNPKIAEAFVNDPDFVERYRALYHDAATVLADAIRRSGFAVQPPAPFLGDGNLSDDERLIQEWNETPGRTQAEVLEVFDLAIKSLD